MQLFSFVWGVASIVVMAVAIVPFLGWLNWVNIPIAVAGVIFGIVASINAKQGKWFREISIGGIDISITASINAKQAKWFSCIGFILCSIAVVVGALRLIVGRGLI